MNKQHDAEYSHYSLIIEWDPRDNIYVVTVPELSGCRTHGKTQEEAVKQAQDAIATWIEGAVLDGEAVPPPNTFTYWSSIHPKNGLRLMISGDDDDAMHYQDEEVGHALELSKHVRQGLT